MRNTTPPTSRKTACFTMRATWRCCARRSAGRRWCWPRPRHRLESWANAEAGKYARLELTSRFGAAVMPEMGAIDMRAEGLPADRWVSPTLQARGEQRLEQGEQSMLFINRRGYAPITLCRACGHQIGCDHCDARMVEHRFLKRLVCHQCGETKPMPEVCPSCEAEGRLAAGGPGGGAAGRRGGGSCFPMRGSRC